MTAKLDFIVGRAGTGKTYRCMQAMRERMSEDPLGPALIMLVPEHMTYRAERELAASLPQQGFLRSYVFGFRRFARQILIETGGARQTRVTDIGRRLILRRILAHHGQDGDLRVFARAARQHSFTADLDEMLNELRTYRLTPEVLREVADDLPDRRPGSRRLSGKLQELALLSEEFQAALKEHETASEDMMTLLARKLPDAPLMRGAEVWLDGFVFFNPQEIEVLRTLLQSADAVHVSLTMDGVYLSGQPVGLPDEQPELRLADNMAETGLFERSYRTMREICNVYAELVGAQARPAVCLCTQNRRTNSAELRYLETGLFASGRPVALEASVPPAGSGKETTKTSTTLPPVRVAAAANQRLELEAVAADILRLAREHGYAWHDIGILLRDQDSYAEMARMVLADYGIPVFDEGKRPSVRHPLAELVRAALAVASQGWDCDTVVRALRTGFFPLEREEIDELENYAREFGLRGRRKWTRQDAWDWWRRWSLDDAEPDERQSAWAAHIDALRRTAVAPLQRLDAALHRPLKDQAGRRHYAPNTVREITTALYGFLMDLQVPEHLAELAEAAYQSDRLADAAEHRQIWQDIMGLFDQIVEVSGDEIMSLKDYEQLLGEGLDALQVSLVPPGLDYVTLADFDQNSLMNMKAIYIVGANDGMMPRSFSDKGLLTDADRLHIGETLAQLSEADASHHYSISPGARERSFGEKFLLYRGFTEAAEYLWVSYALADRNEEGLPVSPLVGRLRALLPQAEFFTIPLASMARHDDLAVAAPRPAIAGLATALRGARDQGLASMPDYWRDVYDWSLEREQWQRPLALALDGLTARAPQEKLSPQLAHQLYLRGGRQLQGSVSQFENYQKCPFQYFARYGLKLSERHEYVYDNRSLGTLMHAVLKEYGERVRGEKRFAGLWQNVPEEERRSLCGAIVDELAPRLSGDILSSRASYMHLKHRLKDMALLSINHLTSWAEVSGFQPLWFEQSFGGRGDAQITPLALGDGVSLSFRGQIDRVDLHTSGKYYLVVDYKTGNPKINLLQIYYGLQLQLLAYLYVARELLRNRQKRTVLPAGMLYAVLCYGLKGENKDHDHELSEEEVRKKLNQELRMPGWVLADKQLIEELGAQNFLYVKIDKEDKPTAIDKGRVNSAEEFDLLMDYVEYILRLTGRDILSGDIAVRPFQDENTITDLKIDACKYCPFLPVCRYNPEIPGYEHREYDETTEEEIEQKMRTMTGREDLSDEIH